MSEKCKDLSLAIWHIECKIEQLRAVGLRENSFSNLKKAIWYIEREIRHSTRIKTSQEVHGWISVEERLPEAGQEVVAFYPFLQSPMLVWYGGKPHSWSHSGTVTHWLPLPQLPSAEVQP